MSVTYNCLIVDDEPLAVELIEEYVSRIPNLTAVGSCSNALEASTWLSQEHIDLLFLDINMPVIKGTDFFKSLVKKPKVIFTTAYREYALEGFEVNALDYLLKPIIFDRFFMAIQKFLNEMNKGSKIENTEKIEQQASSIFITQGHKKIKLVLDDVYYIESFKDYVTFHTRTGSIKTKENIGVMQKRLGAQFLRIHRSYLVHVPYINAFTKQDIEVNERELPIGSSYRNGVLQFLNTLHPL
ncbi:LytTR family DNA-binding domain-containing protein [Aquimarina sp. I32.4]|uniref:LytR/AlgR family response regulator transcription factor n=1 Tax=Aquimarina sp. I32.4 TaxID=2053903 RepID=UPI000CDF18EF|nr:response regulator transcription factor [Aquimarina sp. I32.4]